MKKLMLILLSMFILVSGAMAVSLAKVKIDGKWGFINENGDIIIEPKFDEALSFTENGLAAACLNNKCGFINENGDFVIEPKFDEAGSFVTIKK